MAEHEVVTTDAEIDAAFERAKDLVGEPLAVNVQYDSKLRVLVVSLSNGRRLAMPVENLQGLESASPEQIRMYELVGRGTGIHFPALDADFYVPALIEGVYGNRVWMSELGRKGGSATSEAKKQAARANGARGGRPKKPASSVVAV